MKELNYLSFSVVKSLFCASWMANGQVSSRMRLAWKFKGGNCEG